MACKLLTLTNGQPSKQQETLELLEKRYNKGVVSSEEFVENLHRSFSSETFKLDFGDWRSDYEAPIRKYASRTDENGEPKIVYDKKKDSWFYTNKTGVKRPFPSTKQSLLDYYDLEALNTSVSVIAKNIFHNNFKFDFNNFSIEGRDVNMKSAVESYIDGRIKNLDRFVESGQFAREQLEENYEVLDHYMKFSEELAERTTQFFRDVNLKASETLEEETEDYEFEEGKTADELVKRTSYEKSYKDKIGKNVKLMISFLPDTNNLDPDLLEYGLVSADEVDSLIRSHLSDLSTTFKDGAYEDKYDLMTDAIRIMSKKIKYLKPLVDMMTSPEMSADRKDEFVQAYDTAKLNFFVTEFSKNKENGKVHIAVKNVSNVNSKNKKILNDWGVAFKNNLTNNGEVSESLKEFRDTAYSFLRDNKGSS